MIVSSKITWFYRKGLPIIITIIVSSLLVINLFIKLTDRFFYNVLAVNIIFSIGWLFNGKNLQVVVLEKDYFLVNGKTILFEQIITATYKNLSHLIKIVYKEDNKIYSFVFIPTSPPFIIPEYLKRINLMISKKIR